MVDRTDLQLFLCEQIMEMDTYELMDLASDVTGHELEMHDEEEDIMDGTLEPPVVADPSALKQWLGFMLYALGERCEMLDAAK